ncbi:MAG: signal peptidase I [Acidobacteriaceae bacterium]|jgi:signal peptidase I
MSVTVEPGGDSSQLGSRPGRELDETAPRCDEPGAERNSVAGPGATAPAPAAPHRHSLLQAGQSLLNVIVVALFIITFTVQPFRIPSESMEPTLLVGDFLLVNKDIGLEVPPHVMAPANVIHRGDLIVFHYPIDSSLHLVKRVIGLPGDRIHLRDGRVYIDGHAISEPYAMYRPSAPDSYRDDFPRLVSADPGVDSRWWIEMHSLVANGELTVPADNYFVLGDNRNNSEDSRYWGFVPRADIVGKPFLIYFSLNDTETTPGQSYAVALAGDGSAHREGPADALVDFARWDRAMRVIY